MEKENFLVRLNKVYKEKPWTRGIISKLSCIFSRCDIFIDYGCKNPVDKHVVIPKYLEYVPSVKEQGVLDVVLGKEVIFLHYADVMDSADFSDVDTDTLNKVSDICYNIFGDKIFNIFDGDVRDSYGLNDFINAFIKYR